LLFIGCAVTSAASAEEPFTNGCGMKMLPIPAGSFLMGEQHAVPQAMNGPDWGDHGNHDEIPVHKVTITNPFYLSETEITAEQFRQFRADYQGPELFAPYAAGISWTEADAFCKWLGEKEGKPYRLPTEAEWEYACRAGSEGLFWSGDTVPAEDTNPFGLKRMHTGMSEWCYDWYGLYSCEDKTDPVGRASGFTRVVRGGGIEVHPFDKDDLIGKSEGQRAEATQGFQDTPYGDFPPFYRRCANRASLMPNSPNPGRGMPMHHFIGFRVVQAPLPNTKPLDPEVPRPTQGLKQECYDGAQGPDPAKPYFHVRPILPIPPENCPDGEIAAVGLNPGVKGHNHSGGIAVCPNGDLFMVSFSSVMRQSESSSNTTMVCTRLRRGAEDWDAPDVFLDMADVNDQSALLWSDNGTLWFFGGGRYFGPGAQELGNVPFRFCTSTDNGATWSELKVPVIDGPVHGFTAQPINSAFRGPDSTIYFGMDGPDASSFLWASGDNGTTWRDTWGMTRARHTTFVLLKDNRILAMGGKNADIEGYTPKCYSSDWGKTWTEGEKAPFSALGTNQRPTIMRLKSGRLFFATDCQHFKNTPPGGLKLRGVIVALSDDEGETWHIKPLPLATPHEKHRFKTDAWEPKDGPDHRYPTLGYSAATQGPDGVIHLMSSMNHPSLHFAMNEAWILSDETSETAVPDSGEQQRTKHEERYADGAPRMTWSSRIGADGQYRLDGVENWYHPNGKKQYETTYALGRKVGEETLWDRNGNRQWLWTRDPDGKGVWTQYWPDGGRKIESHWSGCKADGAVTHWDRNGKVVFSGTVERGNM
jgi:formylglycine-generating enzyme required for sulfatase activity